MFGVEVPPQRHDVDQRRKEIKSGKPLVCPLYPDGASVSAYKSRAVAASCGVLRRAKPSWLRCASPSNWHASVFKSVCACKSVGVGAPRRLRGAESQGIKDLLVGLTGVDVLWVPAKPRHPGPNDWILQRRCDQPEDVGAVGCPGGQGLVVFLVGFGDVLGKGNERVCRVPTTRAIVIPTSPVVTRLSDSRV